MKIAIFLAGGKGTRIESEVPKQFIKVNNKPVFSYALSTISNYKDFDAIFIVSKDEYKDMFLEWIQRKDIVYFSYPGTNRQLSILNACMDIDEKFCKEKSIEIMIHDAVRPNLSEEMIREGFEKLKGHDGVLPVLPMKDTVYECTEDGKLVGTLNRATIFAGQAPEFFDFKKYLEANKKLGSEKLLKINGSTEPALMEGLDVVTIKGKEENRKITTKEDLLWFSNERKDKV